MWVFLITAFLYVILSQRLTISTISKIVSTFYRSVYYARRFTITEKLKSRVSWLIHQDILLSIIMFFLERNYIPDSMIIVAFITSTFFNTPVSSCYKHIPRFHLGRHGVVFPSYIRHYGPLYPPLVGLSFINGLVTNKARNWNLTQLKKNVFLFGQSNSLNQRCEEPFLVCLETNFKDFGPGIVCNVQNLAQCITV